MSAETLVLGLVQMTAQEDIGKNIEALAQILESSKDQFDLITTPENALFMRGSSEVSPPKIDINDACLERLSNWCLKRGSHLHIGSVPAADPEHGGERTNATIWINTKGERKIVYRKIHLFDVDVEGVKPRRESANFAAGSSAEIVEIKGWKIGLSICYDLRFAELYSIYGKEGVDLILIPSAFLVPTGRAHWEILIRARAIENQCFVAAAAQSGEHRSGESVHQTYGRSLIVGPWGDVLAEAPVEQSGQVLLCAELKREKILAVRRQIPMAKHRKIDPQTKLGIKSIL